MNSQALNHHIRQMARKDFTTSSSGSNFQSNSNFSQRAPQGGNQIFRNNNIMSQWTNPIIYNSNQEPNDQYKKSLRNYKPKDVTEKITNLGKPGLITYDDFLSRKNDNSIGSNANTLNPQIHNEKSGFNSTKNYDDSQNKSKSLVDQLMKMNMNSNSNINNFYRDNRFNSNNPYTVNSNTNKPVSNQVQTKIEKTEDKNAISNNNSQNTLKGRKPVSTEFSITNVPTKPSLGTPPSTETDIHNRSLSKNQLPEVSTTIRAKTPLNITPVVNPKTSTSSYSVREFSIKEEANPNFRNYMEDFSRGIEKFMGNPLLSLFTLYDGHGGYETSLFLHSKMPDILESNLHGIDFTNTSQVEKAITQSFEQMNKLVEDYSWSHFSGSTACVVLTIKNEKDNSYIVYSANAGDSRTVHINLNNSKSTRLSYDHKATDYSELIRVKNFGGMIFNGRVLGQLAVTRAFGDFNLKNQGIVATPFIKRIDVNSNSPKTNFIIIASDGVWDVLEDEEIIPIAKVYGNTSNELADAILNISLQRGSTDNTSVIAVHL